MSAVVAAMLTAVVGVAGTLLAPLVTYRVTARQRAEDERAAGSERRYRERREAYVALNRASRQFHTLLKDAAHRLRDDAYGTAEREQLEEARLDHRHRYAEAQMIVPAQVLAASRAVNAVLAGADACVKRMDRGLAGPDETPDSCLLDLKEAEPRLSVMTRLMRADLGVED